MEQIDLTFTSNMSNRTSIKVTALPHSPLRMQYFTPVSMHLNGYHCRISDIVCVECGNTNVLLSISLWMHRVIRNRFAVEKENFESSLCSFPSTGECSVFYSR